MVARPGKGLQEPAGDQRHGIGEEKDAGQHEKSAKHFLHDRKMAPEALHEAHERLDGDGGHDEGNAEAERIDEEQADALAHGVFAGRNGEDRAEHGPDTGRPTKGERQADQIGADQARRPRVGMIAGLAVENGNVDHAEKMQTRQ